MLCLSSGLQSVGLWLTDTVRGLHCSGRDRSCTPRSILGLDSEEIDLQTLTTSRITANGGWNNNMVNLIVGVAAAVLLMLIVNMPIMATK